MLYLYTYNLAIKKSCKRKTFDRSVRNAPNKFLLSVAYFHFSNIEGLAAH